MRIPLLNAHKHPIFKLWIDSIEEDIYHRKRIIKEYCEQKNCDFLAALEYIISNIEGKYFWEYKYDNYTTWSKGYDEYDDIICFLFNSRVFINSKSLDPDCAEEKIIESSIKEIFIKTGQYNHEDYYPRYFDSNNIVVQVINKSSVKEETNDLKKQCIRLIKEREKNPEMFNDDILFFQEENISYIDYGIMVPSNNTPEVIITKKNYIPIYEPINLEIIYRVSLKKGFFSESTLYPNFLYVFGDWAKPDDFEKLDWIKQSKNKCINKKLLIAFCMRIFDLKPNDINKSFYEWANKRFNISTPFASNNKPDSFYDSSSLNILFENLKKQ